MGPGGGRAGWAACRCCDSLAPNHQSLCDVASTTGPAFGSAEAQRGWIAFQSHTAGKQVPLSSL
jgi:hypothetical protein